MTFENNKKQALNKKDKSKKGEIDKGVKEIIQFINGHPDYYTTSSCSGRIVLLEKKTKKEGNKWIYQTHEEANSEKVLKSLEEYKGENDVWILAEGLILHIACRTQEYAEKILNIARVLYKHTGIISTKTWTVEIKSTDRLEMPIIVQGKITINEEQLREIITESNNIMKENNRKIHELEERFKNTSTKNVPE